MREMKPDQKIKFAVTNAWKTKAPMTEGSLDEKHFFWVINKLINANE